MSHYRGYFMKSDHVVAPANIDATDDAEAMLKASELLYTSQFLSIEVWQETRAVGALFAPAPSHEFVGTLDKDDPLRQKTVGPTSSSSESGRIHWLRT